MKLIQVLPLLALSTAFVIPDEQVMSQVAIESDQNPKSFLERIPSKDEAISRFEDSFTKLIDTSRNALDDAIEYVTETNEEVSDKAYETAYHVSSWLDSAADRVQEVGEDVVPFSEDDEEHHGGKDGKGRKGHHGHCKKPNLTVYELISKSKYTTKLAALINEYEDIVELLNGTATNYSMSSSQTDTHRSSRVNTDWRPCSCFCANRQSVRENPETRPQAIEGGTQKDITLPCFRRFLPSWQSLGHTYCSYPALSRHTWHRATAFGYGNWLERSNGQLLQPHHCH